MSTEGDNALQDRICCQNTENIERAAGGERETGTGSQLAHENSCGSNGSPAVRTAAAAAMIAQL